MVKSLSSGHNPLVVCEPLREMLSKTRSFTTVENYSSRAHTFTRTNTNRHAKAGGGGQREILLLMR